MSKIESKKSILVTGGAGYIGSNMVRFLLKRGWTPVVFDNLSTGHRSFVPQGVPLVKGDLREPRDVERAFARLDFKAVMHFGAASVVQESVENPEKYYKNNVQGSQNLIDACLRHGIKYFIFSSTAAVYGDSKGKKIKESTLLKPKNPYGETKLKVEGALQKAGRENGLKYILLRYFNACGAHPSGEIGEWHNPETHLIPNVLRAVLGKRQLTVYGQDYPTPDGTCVRDYIHVEDLASAHWAALQHLLKGGESDIFNLGTGHGASVKEIISMVEEVTGKKVPYSVGSRRSGDPAYLVADPSKVQRKIGWKAQKTIRQAVASAWKWENCCLDF
jgi:UDP-glucose-4-epimerase GalE